MATLIARGCERCNPAFAPARATMRDRPAYLDAAHYWELPEPRPRAYVDGEDWMGRGILATVAGEDGWVLLSMDGPCGCGSGNLGREIWRGRVELRGED